MGYFAISKRESRASFSIKACHLNFWILPRTWFRHGYYFDVGLRIVAEDELWRIRVAFPFDAVVGDIADLSSAVLNPETSELIFGRPVTVENDHIKYSASGLKSAQDQIDDRVVSVSASNSSPDAETADDINFSVWTIEFSAPLSAQEPSYVRFRMFVRNPERLWSYKGWGYAKRGYIADIRIADARESVMLDIGKLEVAHLVPIESLYAFLVAPSLLVPQHFSPPLHYSRLLEPSAWAKYLEGILKPSWISKLRYGFAKACGNTTSRAPLSYQDSSKFSIHQWRCTQAISTDTPFRIYADFAREFGRELPFIYFGGALGIAIVTWAVRWCLDWLVHGITPG